MSILGTVLSLVEDVAHEWFSSRRDTREARAREQAERRIAEAKRKMTEAAKLGDRVVKRAEACIAPPPHEAPKPK